MVGRPARRPDRTTAVNSGRRRRRACAGNTSGGELLATLAPTTREDAQPEPVGLRPTAVVRLERALAHEVLPLHDIGGAHPPVGGCARRSVAARRYPVAPEAGHCERRAPTDFDQHNRGNATADGRAHPDHPWCTRGPPAGNGAPSRRARRRSAIVAGLWTGLLASPSLRVGRQGHDAWADPVGQPTAVPPVHPPEQRADLRTCGTTHEPARGPGVHRPCTACGHRCAPSAEACPQTASAAGTTGWARRRYRERPGVDSSGEEERHGRSHARPGDRLGPDPRAVGHEPVPAAERDAQPDASAGAGRGHRRARRP